MAAFIGKWKQDEFDSNKFKEFMKIAGVPEDEVEKKLKIRVIWDIQRDGKKWIMSFTSMTEPTLTQTHEFAMGEPYESTDLFGRKFKMVTTLESDTIMRESSTEWSEATIDIVREVKGDQMIQTATCKGAELLMPLTRM